MVAAGHASPAEVAAHLRAIDHLAIAAPPMFVARGRRRHPGEEVRASVAVDAPKVDGAGRQMVAVRPDGDVLQREWLDGFVGLSDRTSGACGLSMQLVVVPPGGAAPAHWHPLHETGVYVISGEVEVRSGVELEDHLICRSGDFVFTPPGLRHTARNTSETSPAYLIAARNDPSEHESTIIDVDAPWPARG
jgi:uncharacterized RmlC-like cupin family protein